MFAFFLLSCFFRPCCSLPPLVFCPWCPGPWRCLSRPHPSPCFFWPSCFGCCLSPVALLFYPPPFFLLSLLLPVCFSAWLAVCFPLPSFFSSPPPSLVFCLPSSPPLPIFFRHFLLWLVFVSCRLPFALPPPSFFLRRGPCFPSRSLSSTPPPSPCLLISFFPPHLPFVCFFWCFQLRLVFVSCRLPSPPPVAFFFFLPCFSSGFWRFLLCLVFVSRHLPVPTPPLCLFYFFDSWCLFPFAPPFLYPAPLPPSLSFFYFCPSPLPSPLLALVFFFWPPPLSALFSSRLRRFPLWLVFCFLPPSSSAPPLFFFSGVCFLLLNLWCRVTSSVLHVLLWCPASLGCELPWLFVCAVGCCCVLCCVSDCFVPLLCSRFGPLS